MDAPGHLGIDLPTIAPQVAVFAGRRDDLAAVVLASAVALALAPDVDLFSPYVIRRDSTHTA